MVIKEDFFLYLDDFKRKEKIYQGGRGHWGTPFIKGKPREWEPNHYDYISHCI